MANTEGRRPSLLVSRFAFLCPSPRFPGLVSLVSGASVSGVAEVSMVMLLEAIMNKREVAEYLDLSTRAVERAVARGKLSVGYKKDKHGHVALFNPAEVRRYKAKLEVPIPKRPIVEPPMPPTPTAPDSQTPLTVGSVINLSDSATKVSGAKRMPFVPVADKLTLSLGEASSLSGLSEKFLWQAIHKDKLKAFKDEQDWRIKRADLDAFVRKL